MATFAAGGAVLAVLSVIPEVGLVVRVLVTLGGLGAIVPVMREALQERRSS